MTDVTGRLQSLLPSAQTPLGYLFWLSRPRFWLYLAGPVVVGVVYAASTPSEFFTPVTLALFAYFLLPANIFLYGVNDIFDSEIDEANPKKAADGKEVRYSGESTIWLIVVGSAVLGLGFVPVLPLEGTLALVGFLFLGTFYSAPPLRFKTTPFVDSFSNGLYILPAVVAFAAVSGEAPPVMAILAGWVWAMGMHTFSAIPDIEPDTAGGIQTTATVLGEQKTLGYCALMWLLAAVFMAVAHPVLGAVLLVYPLFVAGVVLGNVDVSRAYWWFPVLNTLAGAVLTMAGIWAITYA